MLLDFVPNHTSEQHPWFVDARSSRTARHRDWYVWADPKPDGSPPNNWVSGFGGPAWTLDATTGQYYMHNHLREQPDLNWWNEDVRDTFDDIIRFWFDRGVDGFRIDVCNILIKDAELRDNPPATADDPLDAQLFGQRPVYNQNRPELHDILRRWRRIADSYDPPRLLLGETPVDDAATLAAFYGVEPRRTAPRVQLPVHQRTARGRADARGRRAHRSAAPPRRVARVDRLEPRHVAVRDPVGGRRPAARRVPRC